MAETKASQRKAGGNSVTRGIALFLGCFTLLNLLGTLLGHGASQNIWWIDFSFFVQLIGSAGPACVGILQLACAALLVAWAARPDASMLRRVAGIVVYALLALIAAQNCISYWGLLISGALYDGLPVPFSLVIVLALVLIIVKTAARKSGERRHGAVVGTAVVVWACVAALVFPLLQIVFFGTTDYRREAQVAVVPGAQVHEDGRLSLALAERMDTAIGLYEQGLAPYIIVSGATGVEGVNEATAMEAYAQKRGIPPNRIIVDSTGYSTEDTVRNTLGIVNRHSIKRVLVTSSFYHLPRLKMAFRAQGFDVYTVPTIGDVRYNATGPSMFREIPAWWYYWLKGTIVG